MQRGMWRYIGMVLAATGLTATSACSQTPREPAPLSKEGSSLQTRVPGEYLVTLAAEADVKAIDDLYRRYGIKTTRSLGRHKFLITLTDDPGPLKMEELRAKNPQIEAVQPNFTYRGNTGGNIQ